MFIRSRICLLILPISDLAALITRQVGLLAKLGLWSLRVMKASRLTVVLTRSSEISYDEESFNKAAPIYQKALTTVDTHIILPFHPKRQSSPQALEERIERGR